MRHVRVGQLWIQDEEKENEELKSQKEDEEVNAGDLFTKYVPKKTFRCTDSNDELQIWLWKGRKFVETR